MKQAELCGGSRQAVTWRENPHPVSYIEARSGVRPAGVKRLRLKCPQCGRRLLSSVRTCDDGCCILHFIPPHKPRGWWKKPGRPHEQRKRRYSRGRGRSHGGR